MKKVILLICVIISTQSYAQDTKVARGSIGIGFHAACPQSELKDIKYDDGFGLNLSYLSRKFPYQAKTNFQLGVQMDFANMQSKSFNNLELSDPNIVGLSTARATNSMFGLFALGRINYGTDDDKFVPYINLLVGQRNYSTRQHFSLDDPTSNPDYQSDTTTMRVVHTSRFHYGAGVGFNYRINESLSLESGVTYTFGNAGAALPLDNIRQIEGTSQVDYNDYKTVKTDMLLINVGIRIHLFKHYRERGSTTQPSNTPTNTRYEDTTTPTNTNTNTPKTNDPIIKSRDSIPTTTPTKKSPITPKGGGAVKGGKDKG